MKQTSHIISIPKPCHEDWDAMTPVQQGRHCAACQKTVVDFTLMTDGQIIDIFKNAKDNPPCGSFLNIQLDRLLIDNRYKPSFAAMVAKRVAAIVLLFQSVTTAALAQQVKKHSPAIQHTEKNKHKVKAVRHITGQVVDTTHYASLPAIKTALSNIEIYIKGTDIKTVTDSAGRFSLKVPDTMLHTSITIAGKQGGYTIDDVTSTPIGDTYKTIVIYRKPQPKVTMVEDIVAMSPSIYQIQGGGGLHTVQRDGGRSSGNLYIIDGVEVPKQNFWQRMTKPFRKKHTSNETN